MSDKSDRELFLFLQVHLGDPKADPVWEELHDRWWPRSNRFVIARGIAPKDAPDVVQNAFVRVLRFINKFRAGTEPWSWFQPILGNTCIDWFRKSGRVVPLDDSPEPPIDCPSPEQIAVFDERAILVRHLLVDCLNALDRNILRLKYFVGWPEARIAKFFGMNKKTLSTRIHRAKATLGRELKQKGVAV